MGRVEDYWGHVMEEGYPWPDRRVAIHLVDLTRAVGIFEERESGIAALMAGQQLFFAFSENFYPLPHTLVAIMMMMKMKMSGVVEGDKLHTAPPHTRPEGDTHRTGLDDELLHYLRHLHTYSQVP